MSALAAPAWLRIDADPIAAGLLVGAMVLLAAIYFARHVWPANSSREPSRSAPEEGPGRARREGSKR